MQPTDIPAPMEGYAERVAAYEAQQRIGGASVDLGEAIGKRKKRGPSPMRRKYTAARLHKLAGDAANLALAERIEQSGLWTGKPHPRKVWCSRLRELELHPDRFEAIKARP